MKKVLLAYASTTGTTKEVAQQIKETLEKGEFAVDLKQINQVDDLSSYESIIIGAPINGFKWFPEAVSFVERNEVYLKSIPTALYAMNYIGEIGRPGIRNMIHKGFKSLEAKINPKSIQFFGGKIDKALPAPVRLMFGVKKGSPIDLRRPEQVREWAESLVLKL